MSSRDSLHVPPKVRVSRASRSGHAARFAALAGVAFLSATGEARACRCTQPQPAAALKAADAVVFGRVRSTTPRPNGAIDFTMTVEDAWKQTLGREITIVGSPACIFEPAPGSRYVVFLRTGQDGRLETDSCMGDVPEGRAGAALDYLGRHR